MEQKKEKQQTADSKRTFEKSTLYPYYNLEDCVELLKLIDQLGGKEVSEQSLLSALRLAKPTTRSYSGKISGSKQFGLIETKGKSINITRRGLELLHPTTDDKTKRRDLLREAIRTPEIYQKLISKFDTKQLPNERILANILWSDFKIAKVAKDRAAKVFFESAKYADVLTEDNVLKVNPAEQIAGVHPISVEQKLPTEMSAPKGTHQISQEAGQTLRVALSGDGTAIINVPKNITKEDVNRLKKMLDLLIVDQDQQNSNNEDTPENL